MTMMAVSLPLRADEAQCRSVLKDCDTAVSALQKENTLQAQIIKDEDERFALQAKELNTEQIWKPIALGAVTATVIEGIVLTLKK